MRIYFAERGVICMSEILRVAYNNTMPKKSSEGVVMDRAEQKMSELSKRAKLVKADPKLRHIPNEHDLQVSSDNARFMQPYQHESIAAESEDK